MRYKYKSAHAWLAARIDTAEDSELRSIARALAHEIDGDDIQDLFEDEMDVDGFFVDLDSGEDARDLDDDSEIERAGIENAALRDDSDLWRDGTDFERDSEPL